MSAFKHTPGPWEVDAAYGWIEHSVWPAKAHAQVVARNGESMTPVARCQSNARATDNHANARLIAAAPELLAALEEMVCWHAKREAALHAVSGGEGLLPIGLQNAEVQQAMHAIAKATGGQP